MDTGHDHLHLDAVRAIFFDLGMVLYTFDWRIAIPRFAALNGGDTERIARFLDHPYHWDYERGRFSDVEFFFKAQELAGLRGSFAEFQAIWCEIFTPIPGTIALAEQLEAYYPLYVISNTNPLHARYLETRYDLFKRFRDRFYSFEIGARKPEPEIYRVALARAGLEAAQVLLIDDKLENVAGAQAVGVQTLYAPSPPLAQAKLQQVLDFARRKRAERSARE